MAWRSCWLTLGLVCGLAVGCAPAPPKPIEMVDQAVRDYVTERYGTKLVTDSLRERSVGPYVPTHNFSNLYPEPVDNSAGGRYLRSLDRDPPKAAPRRFEDEPPAPKVRGSVADCNIPASLTDFTVVRKVRKKGGENVFEVEYKATQEIEIDLYELIDEPKALTLLGISDGDFRLAVNQAREQPANLELNERWLELRKTRGWALKLAHKKGTKFVTTGKVTATFGEADWKFELPNVKYLQRPLAAAVTLERCPKGLVAIDPENPQAALEAWKKPIDAFIADVAARETEHGTNQERQSELLKKHLAPGKAWRTRITSSQGSMDIELTMGRVTAEGMYNGTFVAKNGAKETRVEVFGKIEKLTRYDLEAAKSTPDKVPFGLQGIALSMMTSEEPGRPKIWNELRIVLAMNPQEDAPTLVWLDQIKKLEPLR